MRVTMRIMRMWMNKDEDEDAIEDAVEDEN